MPRKPPRACKRNGCPRRAHGTYCADCQRKRNALRGTPTERGYGSKWRRIRKQILQRDPTCKWGECFKPSVQVDHIVPKHRGGSDDAANLQGLCRVHHERKSARENAERKRRATA